MYSYTYSLDILRVDTKETIVTAVKPSMSQTHPQANHRESLCFSSSPEILFLDSFLSLNPLTTEYYGILVRSTASHLLINPDCVLLNILTY